MEVLTGLEPNVGHFKVFESMCFRHVHEQLIKKLDDRSQVMVLIGYYSIDAYKLYSLNKDKFVISRYIQIDKRKS